MLDLTAEQLLTTTRAVRHPLDFDRPVGPDVLRRRVEIALQAPTGRNQQGATLADLWRRGLGQGDSPMSAEDVRRAYATPDSMAKVWSGLRYLVENLHRVPALVIPCIEGRTAGRRRGLRSTRRCTGRRGNSQPT